LIIRRFRGDSENFVGVINGVGISEYGKISTVSFGLRCDFGEGQAVRTGEEEWDATRESGDRPYVRRGEARPE
jgi:hypothetical protein